MGHTTTYNKFIYYGTNSSICFVLVSVTDECASSPCSSGATCVDGFLHFTCICVNGTYGDRCQCMWSLIALY